MEYFELLTLAFAGNSGATYDEIISMFEMENCIDVIR